MATVGLASFKFSELTEGLVGNARVVSETRLPQPGDISTTASTGRAGASDIEILEMPDVHSTSSLNKGQIEVLQREIIGLRRRLGALSEQNLTYSRRIAALEKQVAIAKLSSAGRPAPGNQNYTEEPPAPMSGVIITRPGSMATESDLDIDTGAAQESAEETKTVAAMQPPAAQDNDATGPETRTPSRQIDIYNTNQSKPVRSGGPVDLSDQVRMQHGQPLEKTKDRVQTEQEPETVRLPAEGNDPVATGSIPPQPPVKTSEVFDATPSRTTALTTVIGPSDPAGRLTGGGASQLKRSDFGAVIGHYKSSAAAAKAWADFKEQNEERMRDLQPLLLQKKVGSGNIALLVGPFANAADAAVACLHFLDVTELCRPALYAGDPLVTAAEFRQDAF